MKKRFIVPALFFPFFFCLTAAAAIKTIEAENLYLMGDNDSKIDARRISTQEAKRKALEFAGTYVASLTEVKDYRLTKDEVKAYTAGIVEAEVIAEEMRGTVQRPEIFTKVRCRIDTSVLAKHIESYRENGDLKEQLDAAISEKESLRRERDELLARLKSEKDQATIATAQKKLDQVLTQEERSDATSRLWNKLANRLYDPSRTVSDEELREAISDLSRLSKEDPKNTRARFLLASIYQRQGKQSAAEAEILIALEQAPDNPILRLKMGALLKQRGKFDEALQEFLKAQKGLGDHPHLLFHLSRTYLHLDNCAKATAYAQQFFERIKRGDKPVSEQMKKRARQVLQECNRSELEPRRRR